MKCNTKKSQSHSFLAQPRLEIRLYLLRFTSYKHKLINIWENQGNGGGIMAIARRKFWS